MGYDDARYASWVAGGTPDQILARQQARPTLDANLFNIYGTAKKLAQTEIGRGGSALDRKLRELAWRGKMGRSSGASAQIANAQVANRANILDRLMGVEMQQKQSDMALANQRQSEYDYQTGAMQGELQQRLGIASTDAQAMQAEKDAARQRKMGVWSTILGGIKTGMDIFSGGLTSGTSGMPGYYPSAQDNYTVGYAKGTHGFIKPPHRMVVGEEGPEMVENEGGKIKVTPTSALMKKPEMMKGMVMPKSTGGRAKQRAQKWAGKVRGGGSGRYGMSQGRHGHKGGEKSAVR